MRIPCASLNKAGKAGRRTDGRTDGRTDTLYRQGGREGGSGSVAGGAGGWGTARVGWVWGGACASGVKNDLRKNIKK